MALPDIIRELSAPQSFLVTSHIRPDGDSIGSIMGCVSLLKTLGKNVVAVMQDQVPKKYNYISGVSEILSVEDAGKLGPYDAIVILDIGEYNRVGKVMEIINENMKIINIDHHISNDGFGDASWVSEDSCATAEMLLEVFRGLKIIPDPDAAMALYTGIMVDTGRFRFANTSSRALAAAASLVACGADPAIAAENTFYNFDLRDLVTLGKVLHRVELTPDGKIATTFLNLEEMDIDTEGFVDYLVSINGVEASIMISEIEENRFKISLRSSGVVDVSRVAEKFSGGGHKMASGCRIRGSFEYARTELIKACREMLP